MRKRRVYILLVILSMLLSSLNSCSQGEEYSDQKDDAALSSTINLFINTRATDDSYDTVTSDEVIIKSLRAIVYKVNGNNYEEQIANEKINVTSPYVQQFKLTIPKGNPVRVLLIANEDASWNLADRTLTAEKLKKKPVIYIGKEITTPFVMFGESRTYNGTQNENDIVVLTRNIARVKLTLNCPTPFNGELKLTNAQLVRMAPEVGLGEVLSNITTDQSKYSNSQVLDFNYTSKPDKTFTTNTLVFYSTEHYVTDVNLYTYIVVQGNFMPNNGGKEIPVEYQIPIGNSITTEKLLNHSFSTENLRIERNCSYNMVGTIKSLQQISEIVVEVDKWILEDINGSVNEDDIYKLNILELNPKLTVDSETLVQFWSNQENNQVYVLPDGIDSDNIPFKVDDVFEFLSGKNATNLEFKSSINGQHWGHLRLKFVNPTISAGKTYTITLVAGLLQRTIHIAAIAPEATSTEEK